jgi:inorganic triphosphatase YgiF
VFVAQEIELKLEIDPDNLPLLLGDPLLARARTRSARQVTVYYDTPQMTLRKGGFTLRVRSVDGHFIETVKPVTDAVGLVSREEVEFEIGGMTPELDGLADHPLLALLDGAGSDKLVPVVRSDVTRTSAELDRGHGHVRLDLDHGTICAKKRSHEFAELEFELLDGAPASLLIAARRLSDHLPVRLGVMTKAERGFRLAAGSLGKASKAGCVEVRHGMTVAEAFELVVHACIKHYRLNEPLVVRACSAEALHQARVAMRRLRSAFALFRPAVRDVEFQHLSHELRWFTAQLGEARNLDVYLERGLRDEERARMMRKRDFAYEHVADAMNSPRFRRLLIDIVGWVALGAWRRAKPASRSVMTFADVRLDKLWRPIANGGRDIAQMDATARHKLRIRAKKMRYAAEFLQGLHAHCSAARKRFAAAVEELQESLGGLNDLATARGIGRKRRRDQSKGGASEERRLLEAAEKAFRELVGVGPYWRAGARP